MNNMEILNAIQKQKPFIVWVDDKPYNKREAIENLIQEYKELKEYKKIAELTKISCCTAQNCEALNNAIKNGLENEKLIQENKKLKEKFDVIQRKIYRLEEDNIELLKPRGKDQLNYKYIECPKVEAEWYKSESYIKDNYIPKSKIKEIIYPTPENPIPFEVQTSEMYKKLEKLVEGE